MKICEDNKVRPQKNETPQWKNNKRKIDKENLKLYALIGKATEKKLGIT